MVATIPEGTPPDDAEIARVLLAKGYTVGMIAEHLDAVVEAMKESTR
jgi:SOS response regulatory protein OraA/RecX